MDLLNIFNKFSGLTVMALVGESGTGKSFKSKLLAQKYNIDAIIDDGLLIQNDKILGKPMDRRDAREMIQTLQGIRISRHRYDDTVRRNQTII